jgi:putative addiction module component (TIGR02574 family)
LKSRIFFVTKQDLLAEARKLPLDERAELATDILRTLEEVSEAECEALWNREIDRRIRVARTQNIAAISGEEVLARARASTSSS